MSPDWQNLPPQAVKGKEPTKPHLMSGKTHDRKFATAVSIRDSSNTFVFFIQSTVTSVNRASAEDSSSPSKTTMENAWNRRSTGFAINAEFTRNRVKSRTSRGESKSNMRPLCHSDTPRMIASRGSRKRSAVFPSRSRTSLWPSALEKSTGEIHISVSLFLRAGESSFLPKSQRMRLTSCKSLQVTKPPRLPEARPDHNNFILLHSRAQSAATDQKCQGQSHCSNMCCRQRTSKAAFEWSTEPMCKTHPSRSNHQLHHTTTHAATHGRDAHKNTSGYARVSALNLNPNPTNHEDQDRDQDREMCLFEALHS